MDGGLAVVGVPFFDSDEVSGVDCGIVKVFQSDTGKLRAVLKNPEGGAFGHFGQAVAVSGTRVVVGSSAPVGGFAHAGRVHVFDLSAPDPSIPLLSLENPDPAAYDGFGKAVAIDGDRVLVGEWADDTGELNSGVAHLFDLSSPSPETAVLSLSNPSPAENDYFGSAVAISGARAVVSAYGDDTESPNAGRAYAYDLESGTPGQPVAELFLPGAEENDWFGNAVAIDGAIVVVGAEAADAGAYNAGSVAVFDLLSNTPGAPVVVLTNPDPQENEYFGTSVSISGDLVIAGEYRDHTVVNGGGACHVFDLAGGTPVPVMLSLSKAIPEDSDYFGNAVAISGGMVLAGAWYDDLEREDAGSCYVFDLLSATPGTAVRVLGSPMALSKDHFGSSVGISGDLVVVGSPDSDSGATAAGQFIVYDLGSTSPKTPIATVRNPTPAIDDQFGSAVAISGNLIVVGAEGDDMGAEDAGVVHVFDLTSESPEEPVLTVPNPEPSAGDRFGRSVSISGGRFVVGVPEDDGSGAEAGRAYVFDLSSPTPQSPVVVLNSPNPAAGDQFGSSVAIEGDRIVVGSVSDDDGATDAGTSYVFELGSGTPGVPVFILGNPTPQLGDRFGVSVAISGDRVVVGADSDDTAASNAGSAHVFDLAGATPGVPVITLNHPGAASDDHFGHAVAISGSRVVSGAMSVDGPTDSGRVYVFNLESPTPAVPTASVAKESGNSGDLFGSSVAASGVIVVVGTPSDDRTEPDKGAAYVFGPAAPEIAVKGPLGVVLENGGMSDFGAVAMGPGGGGTLEFTILNTGITGLGIQNVTMTGGDLGDFIVDTAGMAATVPADDDTTFRVSLNPSASGTRMATLRIESSDEDENPFEIQLTGRGLSPFDDTDSDGLNDVSELRMATLGFEWDIPNPALVQAFLNNTGAAGFFAPDQVHSLRLEPPEIAIDQGGQMTLSWSLKRSADSISYDPLPMTAPQTSINEEGELEFLFGVPDNAAFFRLGTK